MSTSLFPIQKFSFSNHLKEFAIKPNCSTIEKTARIAASILLAIPTILLDLSIEFARFINNKFVVKHPDIAPPPYQEDPSAPPAYQQHFEPSAPPIELLELSAAPPAYQAQETIAPPAYSEKASNDDPWWANPSWGTNPPWWLRAANWMRI